jgi:polyhydroxybutyrate depolymerase
MLHWFGGSGRQAALRSGFSNLAETGGFLVAYPDGVRRGWNDSDLERLPDTDDVAFLGRLIDYISSQYLVDPARIFVAGMSNGGFMAE